MMLSECALESNLASSEDIFSYALNLRFGDLHCHVDPASGMRAIIAIHNTKLGPALGGCRFIEYTDLNLAFIDAMRLARGMSYKSAVAGLPLGGGKAVILKPKHAFDRHAYFHAFGQFVDSLKGVYITAMDSGTQLSDMDIIAEHTPFVASLSRNHSDPSHATTTGILRGIQAAVAFQKKQDHLENLTIAIQGLGHVGYSLGGMLHKLGAKLIVSDPEQSLTERARHEWNAHVVDCCDIHKVPCDVFSPCALGAILNDQTISELQTNIIAGAANNQLAQPRHGQRLHDLGIIYAPDYVINSGGVIFACGKYYQTDDQKIQQNLDHIGEVLSDIFARSRHENKPTSQIADAMAEEILYG